MRGYPQKNRNGNNSTFSYLRGSNGTGDENIQYILSPFFEQIRAFYDVFVQDSTNPTSQQECIANFTLI